MVESITIHSKRMIDENITRVARQLKECAGCSGEEDIHITTSYVDASNTIQILKIRSKDLSASWYWQNPAYRIHAGQNHYLGREGSSIKDTNNSGRTNQAPSDDYLQNEVIHPVKLQRWQMRQKRKELRRMNLLEEGENSQQKIEAAAIERSMQFDTTTKGKYSIWRTEFENPRSDTTLKLMRDQIIMAKVYASIARSTDQTDLYNSLMNHIQESRHAIGEAISDAELQIGAIERAKAMGHILSLAKDELYDGSSVARKLRAMIQSTEENVNAQKKKSSFLIQLAAKTVPKPLHCLPLQLTTDYHVHGHRYNESMDILKLEDPSLYHYAIFSDNVLATSVVVNSTVTNAKDPKKHVFHIVTDRLNFAAMKMWFLVHPPRSATIQVENVDDFKWLNSSYCSVLRQLESARLKEYYFKMNHPSSLSAGNDNLKYRNPKYLSMLNHLRFYMPEVYPKLDKILFLDDDVVVQKDLTSLWSIDMKGMVNGAVETCKESFHRFETYLNFSNPLIANNFEPKACGWAFGMNMFDLKEWKKRNITGIYHFWQDSNEDRLLWKLGSLPPGLITFYNLTYPLDRNWHVLGLGYDPAIESSSIERAGVIHYNGNYKPWLDLAFMKYRKYWSKYVKFDDPYLQHCNLNRAAD